MNSITYVRSTGRCLTYRINVDRQGHYTVLLDDRVVHRGFDPLAERGPRGGPNSRAAVGAFRLAKMEIESLRAMTEI